MRLARLDMDLFGHFSGRHIDFGPATASDFHVIHGPNEAGKTTTMEAFLRLLYGFPLREPYDFLHQRKNLRVGGVLEIAGTSRQFIRRPTKTNTLSDESGAVLPDHALDTHLGGLGQDEYRKLLCLDDETIERGGEEIAASKGKIGHLLFSAAAGIHDLSAVLDATRDEAAEIYRKGSSKTEIAQIKKERADVIAQIHKRDVSANAYRSLRQRLEATKAEEASLRTERHALVVRRETLRAQITALPMLDRIDRLATEIAPYEAYPKVLDVSSEELVELLTEEAQANAERDRLTQELAKLCAQRDAIERRPQTLTLKAPLAALEELRGRVVAAAQDITRRRAERDAYDQDMRHAARELDQTGATNPATLVLAPADIDELAGLRDEKRTTARDVARLHEALAEVTSRRDAAEAAAAELAAHPPGGAQIAALFERYSLDRLLPDLATARQALETAEAHVATARAALGSGVAAGDRLPLCPIAYPDAEDLISQWQEVTTACDREAERLATERAEAERLQLEAEHLLRAEGLVDDATAKAARTERDRRWAHHRETLTADSADAVEAAMAAADAIADTRLAHAQSLGQLRSLDHARALAAQRIAEAETKCDALQSERDALATRISDLACACGLPADSSAKALADWVLRHGAASEAMARRNHLLASHRATLDKASALEADLMPLLDLTAPRFDDLIAAARQKAEVARTHREALQQAEARLAELRGEETRQADKLKTAERYAAMAEAAWIDAVAARFDGQIAPDRLEAAFETLTTLREQEASRRHLDKQVRGMEADQAQFCNAVGALLSQHAFPGGSDPLADFAMLQVRLHHATKAEETWTELGKRIGAAQEALDETAARLAALAAKVAVLGQAFDTSIPTSTLLDLRGAVQLAETTNRARAELADLEHRLCGDLGLPDMASVRGRLDGLDKTTLEAEAHQIDRDLEALDARLSAAIEARANAERDVRAVTGDAEIAHLTERKATLEAQWEDAVMRYLEMSLGLRLAEEAIRRYRDVHRSGMMAATERAFAALTNGAYTALRAEPDGADEILVALDTEGRAKQAKDMSKGTRFQLYLALRAAAYEQLVEQGIRLPFFCDDIFETFDEKRTRAACQVMARIGRQGQAIYLTHHAHVVEIAREVCGDDVRLHELSR